jgi:hypothetical protein
MPTSHPIENHSSVDSYLQLKSVEAPRVGKLHLAGVRVITQNPQLAKLPRLVDFLRLFIALWAAITNDHYEREKVAVGNFNRKALNDDLKEWNILKVNTPIAFQSKAQQLLFTPDLLQNKLLFHSLTSDQVQTLYNLRKALPHATELKKLLPANSALAQALADLQDNAKLIAPNFNSYIVPIEALRLLAKAASTSQDHCSLKLLLQSWPFNTQPIDQQVWELLGFLDQLEQIPNLSVIPEEEFEEIIANNQLSLAKKLQQFKESAIQHSWEASLATILKVSDTTTFKGELISHLKRADYDPSNPGFQALTAWMAAMQEVTDQRLPEKLRISEKEFIESILKSWQDAAKKKGYKGNSTHFFTHLQKIVTAHLSTLRIQQQQNMYLLAEQFAGKEFATDFCKHYTPKLPATDGSTPLLLTPFAQMKPAEKLLAVAKAKSDDCQSMATSDFDQMLTTDTVEATLPPNGDQTSTAACYARLNALIALPQRLATAKSSLHQLSHLWGSSAEFASTAKSLAQRWQREILQHGSDATLCLKPLETLMRAASDLTNEELSFGADLLIDVIATYAAEQQFPHALDPFTHAIEGNGRLTDLLRERCQQAASGDLYRPHFHARWRQAFQDHFKSKDDGDTVDIFALHFNHKQLFRGGVNSQEVLTLVNTTKEACRLAETVQVAPQLLAAGCAQFLANLKEKQLPLRVPTALELIAHCPQIPPAEGWEETLHAQLAKSMPPELFEPFIDALKQAGDPCLPRTPQEIAYQRTLYTSAVATLKANVFSQSIAAYTAVAEACATLCAQQRAAKQPLEIPSEEALVDIYSPKLPEWEGWQAAIPSQSVIDQLADHGIRGPISKSESQALEHTYAAAQSFIERQIYTVEVVTIAIRRLVAAQRYANVPLRPYTTKELTPFCFEAFIETCLQRSGKATSLEAPIALLSAIGGQQIPLTAAAKERIALLAHLAADDQFAEGRGPDHFRVKEKFPALLNTMGIATVEGLNNYPLDNHLFVEQWQQLISHSFANLNGRELLKATSNDLRSAIIKLLSPVISSLTSQEPLTPKMMKQIDKIATAIAGKHNSSCAVPFLNELLGGIHETGSVEISMEISLEKICQGTLQGISSLKRDELANRAADDSDLPLLQQLFRITTRAFTTAQEMRSGKRPVTAEATPVLDLLDGLKQANVHIASLIPMGSRFGGFLLKIPGVKPLLTKIVGSVVKKQFAIVLNKIDTATIEAQQKGNRDKIEKLDIQRELIANLQNEAHTLIAIGVEIAEHYLNKVDLAPFIPLAAYVSALSSNPSMAVDEDKLIELLYQGAEASLAIVPEMMPALTDRLLEAVKGLPATTNAQSQKIDIAAVIAAIAQPSIAAMPPSDPLVDQLSAEKKSKRVESMKGDLAKKLKETTPPHLKGVMIALFIKAFDEVIGSLTFSTQKDAPELLKLAESASQAVQKHLWPAFDAVEACRNYYLEQLGKGDAVEKELGIKVSATIGTKDLLPYLTGETAFSLRATQYFTTRILDPIDLKERKEIASKELLIPAFSQTFAPFFAGYHCTEKEMFELLRLAELSTVLIQNHGYAAADVAAACLRYCEELRSEGQPLQAPNDTLLGIHRIANEAKSLLPYHFDLIVEQATAEVIAEGACRTLPGSSIGEPQLAAKVKLFINKLRIRSGDSALNGNGRAVLKEIVRTLLDPQFAPGRSLFDPVLLERWNDILLAIAGHDVALLNSRDPSTIGKMMSDESARLAKLNLGVLQQAIKKAPERCMAALAHPIIDSLMHAGNELERQHVKMAMEKLATGVCAAPLAKKLETLVDKQLGAFNFLAGITLEVDVSLPQLIETIKTSTAQLREELHKGNIPSTAASLRFGALAPPLVATVELFAQAQQQRNAAALYDEGSDNPAGSLARVLDIINDKIGGAIKLTEFGGDKLLFGKFTAGTADFAAKMVQSMADSSLLRKMVAMGIAQILDDEIAAIQLLESLTEEQQDKLVLLQALKANVDDLVTLACGLVISIVNSHDMTKHEGLMNFFFQLIAHPERRMDPSELMGHLLTSVDAFAEESRHSYRTLIPGIMGALAGIQKFAR